MAVTAHSAALFGVDGIPVHVEVDLVRRLPGTTIVGLPTGAVRESAERVRSAICAAGFEFPRWRLTVNLAPADLKKEGSSFDLPIALGILAASGQLPDGALEKHLVAGELSLSGALRPIRGALSLAMAAAAAGHESIILPRAVASQAAVVPGITAYAADDLGQVAAMLRGEALLPEAEAPSSVISTAGPDLSEVRGQLLARRALEIAAAGGHNLLMVGPPGVGKTMLATRLPGILPSMRFHEALEATRVHSAAGMLPDGAGLLTRRPFRAPHHSISAAGLLGGATLRPGELSLAHQGVLFLDELTEFSRSLIEQLRGPLESREIVLARSAGAVRLPGSCMLLAATNPCPCGFLGHPSRPCRCTDGDLRRFGRRLSGPLLDRIDMHIRVDPVPPFELVDGEPGESTAAVRARVEAARARQELRLVDVEAGCNAELDGARVRHFAAATRAARRLLSDAVDSLSLSGRGHDRLLKVARTIADLEGADAVDMMHVAEAITYRAGDAQREAA